MSITYEEALATLTSMFGSPWNEESLDTVLRHHEGHMENTVETVLAHGDGDPQALLDRLKNGDKPGSNASTSMDEELARQLEDEERQRSSRSRSQSQPAPAPKPKGRGTPTELPPDFLRIPGYKLPVGGVDADERLARMLQDELFSKELANNPEFAHLSRNRPRTVGGRPTRYTSRHREISSSTVTGQRRPSSDGPPIMEKLSEMGESAKKRLTMLAAQWNTNLNARRTGPGGRTGGQSVAASEQRGLLDGDGDDGFGSPHEMEMSSSPMGFGSKKDI